MNETKFDLALYMQPIWQGRTVHHESIMLLEDPDGHIPDVPLLYRADDIYRVRSADLQTDYIPDIDFRLVDGRLFVPPLSTLPRTRYDSYYLKEKIEGHCFPLNPAVGRGRGRGSGYIAFGEGATFHQKQLAVTYTHHDTFPGEIPSYQGSLLPRTIARLQQPDSLHVLVYGDSIATGANASGRSKAAPFMPGWFDLLVETLRTTYNHPSIQLTNTSVGGTASRWGADQAQARAARHKPDLAIIGFGMNDGSGRVRPEDYLVNIQLIMDRIRAAQPECEFILIATMLPNIEVSTFWGVQKDYRPGLLAMQGNGVAVADMTAMHGALLQRKRYYDMTGNNVNHPNDFLARVYAQVLAAMLIP